MKSMEIPGQINLFDYIKKLESPLPTLDRLAEVIREKYGINLVQSTFLDRPAYEINFKGKGKCKVSIHDSKYTGTDKRFVSVDFEWQKGGFGCPCDTEESVLKWIGSAIKEAEKIRTGDVA